MKRIINRKGFDITVTDNTSAWIRKADKAGFIKQFMWDISSRVEEWGIMWTYKPKEEYTYPFILGDLK